MKLNISNAEFHLNFQKILSGKICIELDIANVEFHVKFKNKNILLYSLKMRLFSYIVQKLKLKSQPSGISPVVGHSVSKWLSWIGLRVP